MINAIVPQFFSANLPRTLNYYDRSLGFEIQFQYGDPVEYAGAIRDGQSIFFRVVPEPLPVPDGKYAAEWLDAYITVEDSAALFEEYQTRNVTFHRELGKMPHGFREFVVRDPDGRLLCFGQYLE